MSGYSSGSRSRPLGVAVLAVLLGLVGLFFILGGLFLLFLAGAEFAAQVSPLFGIGIVASVLWLVLGIVFLVVATGLWRLEMWALALAVLVVIFLLIDLAVRASLLSISGLLLVLLLVYLVLVRHHFR